MAQSKAVDVCFSLARAANGAIGYHGKLPWRLPADLKRFKELSMGKPIVMGRASFTRDLERRVLPGRLNIVCSQDPAFTAEGVVVARSIEEALRIARDDARKNGKDEIHVIGGAQIFRTAMPYAQRVYLTEVDARPEADTFIEAFDPALWRESVREPYQPDERNTLPYAFVVLERRDTPQNYG